MKFSIKDFSKCDLKSHSLSEIKNKTGSNNLNSQIYIHN